jgi:hypothetical protein
MKEQSRSGIQRVSSAQFPDDNDELAHSINRKGIRGPKLPHRRLTDSDLLGKQFVGQPGLLLWFFPENSLRWSQR